MSDIIGKEIEIPHPSYEGYKRWFILNLQPGFDFDRYNNYYSLAVDGLCKKFVESGFWQKLAGLMSDIDARYLKEKGVCLFSNTNPPQVLTKSFDSLFNKSYRKNILNNKDFPNAPQGGWVTNANWFEKITDIVRTSFVVRYLDGVKILTEEINRIADECGVCFSFEYVARDEGYYASHILIKQKIKLFQEDWTSVEVDFPVEIQVTTELQETIKGLLHKYYEKRRIETEKQNYVWQWNYEDEQFKSNYLGHMAHYIEGMIVEIRDKQRKI